MTIHDEKPDCESKKHTEETASPAEGTHPATYYPEEPQLEPLPQVQGGNRWRLFNRDGRCFGTLDALRDNGDIEPKWGDPIQVCDLLHTIPSTTPSRQWR